MLNGILQLHLPYTLFIPAKAEQNFELHIRYELVNFAPRSAAFVRMKVRVELPAWELT